MGGLFCCVNASPARADGGKVRVSEHRGRFHITVFTTPTPPRAGPVDISVLVQDAATGEPLTDTHVAIELSPAKSENRRIAARATHEAATNALLLSAVVDLPTPGAWEVLVRIEQADHHAEVRFEMEIQPPPPGWFKLAGWIAWPAAVILLYGMHRLLAARKHRMKHGAQATLIA